MYIFRCKVCVEVTHNVAQLLQTDALRAASDATITFLCKAAGSGEQTGYDLPKQCAVGIAALALLPCIANSCWGTGSCFGQTVKTSEVSSSQYSAHGTF